MTAAVERIRQEASQLPFDEREVLVRMLERDLDSASDEDALDTEKDWDAEIADRANDVEEGKVELISGAELRRSTDALLGELGIKNRRA